MTLPFGRLAALALLGAAGTMLAGCDDSYLDNGPNRSEQPISSATLAEMTKIDTTPSSPVVIRTYKKEAELEIWKMKSDGHYALLKTYPMCRWSGQLGPKTREGDMQVPEGFYTIAPGQMNPNSHYYLAFNVGYPNAYDRALGRTGGSVMVHGVCSSAGCFSMTDEQVADIYTIARDAFRGGQQEIQLQSYPFHMTAENLAKYRLDPNIAFWKELKNGSDHFEVTQAEPPVVVCGKHYVFGATTDRPASASAPCPALHRDDDVETAVAEKAGQDEAKVAELVASGVKPIRTVYADGGQNPVFAGYKDESDPEALVAGAQDIVLAERVSPAVRIAAAQADAKREHAGIMARINGTAPPAAPAGLPADAAVATAEVARAPTDKVAKRDEKKVRIAAESGESAPAVPVSAPQPQTQTVALASTSPPESSGGVWGASTSTMKKWLHLGGEDPAQPAITAYVPDQPVPSDVPLPPRRDASVGQGEKPVHVAVHVPLPPAKPAAGEASKNSTDDPAAPATTSPAAPAPAQ
jgi:murein L,D-transpeptidase YafK